MTTEEPIMAIEEGPQEGGDNPSSGDTSAHVIGKDSWQQVGLMLGTSYNCGFILSFSNLMLVPLGLKWGTICMLVFGYYTAYAHCLLAEFHFIDGRRFIRYRDLMGFLYGRKLYYVTWVMQASSLLLLNMGFIVLAASALKEISSEVSDHSPLRLQIFIIIAGVAFFMFAFSVPTMSAMRMWSLISLIFTSTYILILLVFLVKDGKSSKHRDYEIKGSKVEKVFNVFSAISAICFSNTAGMLPETQSTLRQPAVKNMRKALSVQYSVGMLTFYSLTILGYWAYGSSVSVYLPEQINAAKWVKLILNSAVFLQAIVSQHMFSLPIQEAFDTKFLKLEEKLFSKENIKRRFYIRSIQFVIVTFFAAAFPFMGDFVNLIGSFAFIPLTFVFATMVFLKVKGKTASLGMKAWHWFNIVLFTLLTVATSIAALRLIINHIQEYSFFADA